MGAGLRSAATLRPAERLGAASALGLLGIAAFGATAEVLVVLGLVWLLALRETATRGLAGQERTRFDFVIAVGVLACVVVVARRVAEILA